MRKAFLSLILFLSALLLNGCSITEQVENQAYVLALGVDKSMDGGIELSIQIPKISGNQPSSSGTGGSGSPYMSMHVTAGDYEHALERLNWALPRNINLGQLELIVISDDIARSEECHELLNRLENTEDLYTAASVVVCEGSAAEFISALKPSLGSRLSADIRATIDHYHSLGVIPDCSLAEIHYRTNSVYSDPMAGYGILEKNSKNTEPDTKTASSSLDASLDTLSDAYESEIETRYLGAAVFSQGRCVGVLNGKEAILANLIRNSLDRFRWICGRESLAFRAASDTIISVNTNSDPAVISMDLFLSIEEQENPPGEDVIRQQLTDDLYSLIETTRDMSVEPFGFAEAAARNFPTLEQWLAYDWKSRFANAEIEIKLHINSAGS